MTVKQQLMNTSWILDRDAQIDYLPVLDERDRRKVGDRVVVDSSGGPENARPFGGKSGQVVAVSPDGLHVELRIKDGADVFHIAMPAGATRTSR